MEIQPDASVMDRVENLDLIAEIDGAALEVRHRDWVLKRPHA
jgi:hypothetical protein